LPAEIAGKAGVAFNPQGTTGDDDTEGRMSPRSYGLRAAVIGNRLTVTGEIDRSTFPWVMFRLEPMLQFDTVELDLSAVEFLAVRTALGVRELQQHALSQGCELVVAASSYAVERALEMADRVLDTRDAGHTGAERSATATRQAWLSRDGGSP